MKSEILLFNGERVKREELNYTYLLRGFLYGDGIFETLISINRKIFRFEDHWKRMEFGAEICNLKIPSGKMIEELIVKNLDKGNFYIRLNLWRKNPDRFNPGDEKEANFLIIIKDFEPYPKRFYKNGLKCCISKKIRRNEKSLISKIKSINYLENIIAKFEAKENKVDDVIVLDNSGYISEGSVSNIFFIKDEIIYTPSLECGCLEGITRKVVFEICKKEKIEIREGFFNPDFLRFCDEVFLTNTLMGIMPVKEIKEYFKSRSFKITNFLSEKYTKFLHTHF